MTETLADVPPDELPELMDIIIWEMSGPIPVAEWRTELLARPDVESDGVQRAIAVCDEYLAPHGSPEAKAAAERAWPTR